MNFNLSSKLLKRKIINKNLIIGFLCESCYSFTLLSQNACQSCNSKNLKIANITNKAIISSFTVIRTTSLGVKKRVLIAKVITPEGYCLIGNIIENSLNLFGKKMNLINKRVSISFDRIDSKCYIRI